MEHRQRRPEPVPRGQLITIATERNAVADHRLVRDQATFRIRGRTGRVEHHADVAHAHAEPAAVHRLQRHFLRERGQLLLGHERRGRRLAEQHDVAQPRRGWQLERERVLLCGETGQCAIETHDEVDLLGDLRSRDDRDEVAVLDHVAELVRLVACVDRHRDGTAQRNREKELDELGTGRQQQADVLARTHTECLQRPCPLERACGELRIGHPEVRKHQRLGIGVAIRGGEQQVADRRHLDADFAQVLRTRRRACRLACCLACCLAWWRVAASRRLACRTGARRMGCAHAFARRGLARRLLPACHAIPRVSAQPSSASRYSRSQVPSTHATMSASTLASHGDAMCACSAASLGNDSSTA